MFVLCVSISELIRILRANEESLFKPLSKGASAFWLLSCGLVQGLWVSGGPLIAYWAGRTIRDKGDFRSTVSCLFLILNVILLVTHILAGRITGTTFGMSLVLMPSVFLGIIVGEWLHVKLPDRGFRVIVFLVLIFAGAANVLRP